MFSFQAPDVSWNRPFKAKLVKLYGEWIEHGKKTYTKFGNVRAASKSQLADMIVESWKVISEEAKVQSTYDLSAGTILPH